MITIDQLLESVDLDFEPRWVTKDKNGYVELWETKPRIIADGCWGNSGWRSGVSILKLAEFANKPWQECIYEVPRKTTGKIEKIEVGYNNSLKAQDWQDIAHTVANKINELVEAVNELRGDKHPISNPQADKAERLQKAVNTALISIGTAAIFDGEDAKKYANAKIDLIKQLIKGE